jgi:5S rRNA maturation endonuclease (ribonuclease M5)
MAGKAFHSPFREDKNPSCQLGGEKNIFFDHATGESLDSIALTRKVRGCSFADAVAFVLGRKPEDLVAKNGSRPGPSPDAIEELAIVRGWKPEALRALGAEARNSQAPREVHFPMRDAAGNRIGTRRRQADGRSFSDGGKVKCIQGSKQGLLCPWPSPDEPEKPVLVVEGEADAAAALSAGWKAVVATPGAQPSKEFLHELQLLLARREVVLFPDPDEAGRKWLARIGKALLNAQCRVRFVPAADEDLDKRLRRESAPEKALAGMVETALPFETKKKGMPNPNPRKRDLPEVQVNNRQLRDIIADAWAAVHAKNDPASVSGGRRPFLFLRSGGLVRLSSGKHGQEIEPMEEHAVFGMLARVADWVRVTDEACVDTSPVKDVARDMLAYPDENLPPLDSVATAPLFGASGDLVTAPGYHRAERLWFMPEKDLGNLDVPESPTPQDIEEARSLLTDELLVDFPFVDESDRAHVLAAMILPFVRRMIDGCTPLHLVEAPMAGSGKGLLCNLISLVATGRVSDGRTLASQDDEARKMLTAELSRGRPIILLDNTDERKKLDCPSLASVVTSETWTDRLLGKTAMLTLPNRALWLVTGNNPALSMEIARRCIRIRIDPRVDRPWQRSGFKYPVVVEWAKENRSRLVRAVLVLVRAWIAASRPMFDQRLGSFERWSGVIGGILDVAGIPGFLGSLEDLYENADAEGQVWREFTSEWWDEFGTAPMKVGILNDFCESRNLMVSARGEGTYRSQEIRLGFALSRARDRVFGGLRVTRVMTHGKHKGGACYALVQEGPGSGPGHGIQNGDVGDLWGCCGDVQSKHPHEVNQVLTNCYEQNGDVGDVEGGTHAPACMYARAHTHARVCVITPNIPNIPKNDVTPGNKNKCVMGMFARDFPMTSPTSPKVPISRNGPIDLALIPDGIEPEEPEPP